MMTGDMWQDGKDGEDGEDGGGGIGGKGTSLEVGGIFFLQEKTF